MVKKAQSKKRPAPSKTVASKTSGTTKRTVAAKKKAPTKKAGPTKKKAPQKKTSPKKGPPTAAATARAAEARRKKQLKAVELYERALEALQRRDLRVAANRFKKVIREFPAERELHERSRRYLEVCERHLAPAPAPKTLEERVYAATLALNAGSEQEALRLLESALAEAPDSEQVQYMLAVARAAAGDQSTAVTHLHRAIELNPDNRFLARHEPSFEALHDHETFQQMLASPGGGGSGSTRQRRS